MNTEIVETFSGEFLPKEKCRRIKGNWYKIGDSKVMNSGECYLIGDKYYRDTEFITYDYAIKKYVIHTINMTYGVVDIKEDGETLVFGHYSQNNIVSKELKIIDKEGNPHSLIDYNIVKDSFHYLESNLSQKGIFVHRSIIKTKEIFANYEDCSAIKNSLPYSCSPYMIKTQSNLFRKNIDNLKISDNVKNYAKYLKNYTFGAEFETSNGVIPNYVLNNYGIIPLRDGSINGLEYVTIPHSGEEGLQALLNTIEELKNRTTFSDRNCSFHLHIGGMPRTISYITALFKILDIIEPDIFELFPLYKENNYRIKRKSYTRPLPKSLYRSLDNRMNNNREVLSNFKKIFSYLSMGVSFEEFDCDLSEVSTHPNDNNNDRKWQVDTRYHWINVIPLIFGNKETIEFRIHTPSYNKTKIINFLYLCVAIIEFVKRNEDSILKNSSNFSHISLSNIIQVYSNSHIINELSYYIMNRKSQVYDLTSRKGVYFKENDIIYDNGRYINWDENSNSSLVKYVSIGLENTPQIPSTPTTSGWVQRIEMGSISNSYVEESVNVSISEAFQRHLDEIILE